MWVWIETGTGGGGGGAIIAMLILGIALCLGSIALCVLCPILAVKKLSDGETALGITSIIVGVLSVLFVVYWVSGLVNIIKETEASKAKYNRDPADLSVSLVDKQISSSGRVIFDLSFTNHTGGRIIDIEMDFVVTDSHGEVLLSDTLSGLDIDHEETVNTTYTVPDAKTTDLIRDIDMRYLTVTITIRMIDYNDIYEDPSDPATRLEDTRTLHTADTEALAAAYRKAVSSYEAGDFADAVDRFRPLGHYENSAALRAAAEEALRSEEEPEA